MWTKTKSHPIVEDFIKAHHSEFVHIPLLDFEYLPPSQAQIQELQSTFHKQIKIIGLITSAQTFVSLKQNLNVWSEILVLVSEFWGLESAKSSLETLKTDSSIKDARSLVSYVLDHVPLTGKEVFFLPGACERAFDLEVFLTNLGYKCLTWNVYQSSPKKNRSKKLADHLEDCVFFLASPKAAQILKEELISLGRPLTQMRVLAIGETTALACQDFGSIAVCADSSPLGICQALKNWF